MVLGRIKVSYNHEGYNNNMNLYFDKKAGGLIDSHVVFDKAGLRFRNATIDDRKTYKANRINNCTACVISAKFPESMDMVGVYEVEESEDRMWYEMYKV